MSPAELRAAFPVFEHLAYLNAGTCGPLPLAAVEATTKVLAAAAGGGRFAPYFERLVELHGHQRAGYAALLGADADDVALTTSTSEGMVRVLAGLDLRRGDEVLTSDAEHPGLLGPLGAAQRERGVHVREVPLERIADEIGPATRLVACSHVGWVSGNVVPSLREVDVPVLLDGAQGVGAVPVDLAALGCDFYAGSGQKWLCGPVGTGMLWVSPAWRDRLGTPGPTYLNLEEPAAGLAAAPRASAARYDTPALSLEACAGAAAAFVVLARFGWDDLHERASALATALAEALTASGRVVAPRGATTLVAWEDPSPAQTRDRLAAEGVVVRDLPGTPLLRASVGAWNDESDLERLLGAL